MVGERGLVIAIEPQAGLRDIIHVNLALNKVANFRIYTNALGGDEHEQAKLHLYPDINTGASSIARKYRWAGKSELIEFVTLERIFNDLSLRRIDFAKVDVEGYEAHVVKRMLPHIRTGRIRKLLIDYHEPILREQGFDPKALHRNLVDSGMIVKRGDATTLNSYLLYEYAAQGA